MTASELAEARRLNTHWIYNGGTYRPRKKQNAAYYDRRLLIEFVDELLEELTRIRRKNTGRCIECGTVNKRTACMTCGATCDD